MTQAFKTIPAVGYPFAPYQFSLVQSIFESIRKAGATGLHLARGERSLLDAFQSAAKAVAEEEPGILVPLYRFYPSIESFLEGVVKSTIENASKNPSLKPFDVLVLKTLFLIRYVDEIPGNVDNLITLFIDQIDADRKGLRTQIEESLQRLEGQTLVSRNGDVFFFLTNEERDVSREIKAVDLSAAEEAKKLGELIFEDLLGGMRKFRFTDNGNDFGLNLSCDQHPYGNRNEGALGLQVITPLIDDRDEWRDDKTLLRSGDSDGQVILRLPDDQQLASELRQYIQTDKYVMKRPYGWSDWETVLLVVRLVKAGELSLKTNQTLLPIEKVYEQLNPPSRWRSVEVEPRKAISSSDLQKARNLTRDVFGKLPPEDEDRIYAAKHFGAPVHIDDPYSYLPMQYLVDKVKARKFDGIRFKSMQKDKGINTVVFNPANLACVDVQVFGVKLVKYEAVALVRKPNSLNVGGYEIEAKDW